MKKVLCMIIAVICLSSFAYAEFDFSSMTDSELLELISSAQTELKNRSDAKDKEIVLYNENDIKVYLTRNYKIRELVTKGEFVIDFECIVENNSSYDVTMKVPDSSMNDWELGVASCYTGSGGFGISVSSNKKGKGVICFSLYKTNIRQYKDIRKIDFTLNLFLGNDYFYSKDICLEFVDGVMFFKK